MNDSSKMKKEMMENIAAEAFNLSLDDLKTTDLFNFDKEEAIKQLRENVAFVMDDIGPAVKQNFIRSISCISYLLYEYNRGQYNNDN